MIMTTSKHELDLRPALLQYKVEQLSISQFAALVAQQLNELSRWAKIVGEEHHAQALDSLWQRFNFISGDSRATVEELDNALEELYSWADSPARFDSEASRCAAKSSAVCTTIQRPELSLIPRFPWLALSLACLFTLRGFELIESSIGLDDELTAHHIHPAVEGELAWRVRRELNGHGLALGQHLRDAKVAEDDLFRAGRAFFAAKVETHPLPALDLDAVGRITAFDHNGDFLGAARTCCRFFRCARAEEKP